MMKVKCNRCGHVADESEFPKGRDFFQHEYIRSCPTRCGNFQSPGPASMRMMDDGERPFVYLREETGSDADSLTVVLHRAGEAS